MKACVLTISDRASSGEMVDESGPAVEAVLAKSGFEVTRVEVIPDNRERIIDSLLTAIGQELNVVVSTGGTGLGPRDLTPQATAAVLDFEVPGLAEEMRRSGMQRTPMAALSRAICGVRGRSLIVNLPGSSKGAVESLEAILPMLRHAVELLSGQTEHV